MMVPCLGVIVSRDLDSKKVLAYTPGHVISKATSISKWPSRAPLQDETHEKHEKSFVVFVFFVFFAAGLS